MAANPGNKFIPSFIFSNFLLAIVAPYLVILLRDIGYGAFWTGLLLGVFEAAGIIGPFLLGYRADKTGNYRPVMVISCVLPAIVAFPLIIWVNPPVSFITLFFIAFGLRSLMTLIDAITTVHIGIKGNYGSLRMWGSIGFIFLTLFFHWTPFLRPDNARIISLWIEITALSCLIPVFFLPGTLLKVSAASKIKEETPEKEENTGEKPVHVTFAYIFCGFAIIFLSRFGMSAILTYLPLYMTEIVEWDAIGLIFALAAIAEVPLLFLCRRLIRRFGAMPMLAFSTLGVLVRLLILAFLPFKSWIVVSSLLHSICFGIYHPAAIHFITTVYPVEKRARGMSMYMIMGTGLPSITGIMAGGAIIEGFGYSALFIIYAAVAAAALIIYGVLKTTRSIG
jgi:PPP family 3-phenylpropionic acid transporter